jgi:hypothetical protein
MKLGVVIALALVLINIQAAFLHVVGATLVKVDVGVVVIALMALDFMPLEGAIGAFFVGYFEDLLSGRPTGLYAFLGVLIYLTARFVGAAVDVRGPGGFAAMAGLTSLAYNFLAFLVTLAAADSDAPRSAALLSAALPTAFWTVLASLPLFFLIRKIEGRFAREEPGLLR